MAICKNCGNALDDNTTFCPFCGANQSIGAKCPNCGKEISGKPCYCPECGTYLGGNAQNYKTYTAPNPTYTPSQRTYEEEQKYSGMAIAGFILSFFVPILGVIFSIIGLNQCKNEGRKGHGLAVAGIVISIVFFVINLVALL